MTYAEAQRRNKQIADSVLIKALKVIMFSMNPEKPAFAGSAELSLTYLHLSLQLLEFLQRHTDEVDITMTFLPQSSIFAAMQTLCALVSHDDAKQRWLQSTGILGLLQRLTVQETVGSGAVPLPPHPILNLGESAPLRLWRESARIIAMISADAASQTMIRCLCCSAECLHILQLLLSMLQQLLVSKVVTSILAHIAGLCPSLSKMVL